MPFYFIVRYRTSTTRWKKTLTKIIGSVSYIWYYRQINLTLHKIFKWIFIIIGYSMLIIFYWHSKIVTVKKNNKVFFFEKSGLLFFSIKKFSVHRFKVMISEKFLLMIMMISDGAYCRFNTINAHSVKNTKMNKIILILILFYCYLF